jgi:uncharacterized YccA/Bax inhibitor family protein
MPSPVLNERTLRSAHANWPPPEPPTNLEMPPIHDGPISTWRPQLMTVNGTITATATLFAVLLAAAAIGWINTGGLEYDQFGNPQYAFPALAWVGMIAGFGLAILLAFKPRLAKFLAPVYAVAEGFFVGALSKMYETYYHGIVVQAAGAAIGVFAVMLVLYRTRILKVTDRMRSIIVSATLGVMVFYGVCLLVRLFAGADAVSFLSSSSALSIGFSILVAGLAAFNLALDFDFIERGSRQGLDKDFEWYAAFGLLVTMVWLYLELLRLLAKLRDR